LIRVVVGAVGLEGAEDLEHVAVARGRGVVRLVDDDQAELPDPGQSVWPGQRLDAGHDDRSFHLILLGADDPDVGIRIG